MRYRKFGGTGVRISEIGLGTWQLGGTEWGEIDELTALETLHAAAEAGVNFFDTADVYGLGRSERLIGEFLRRFPGDYFVATKLGRFPEPGWPENFSAETIRAHTEASLRRLGVERIDLTQLHCIPVEELRRGEVFEALRSLQSEGKIRSFGVSVESAEEAELCLEQDGVAALQIIFNIFRRRPIDFFERARSRGVALIVRLPLASGLLAGGFDRGTRFDENDHRSFNRDGARFNVGETFAGIAFEIGVELTDGLRPLVPDGMTMAEMALRWTLDFEAVTTVIPGARNPEQARGNARASDLAPLTPALHRELSGYYESRVRSHIRGPY
jgi:aryl-alcohol dehydrogenase-like predicted oxidoreductase